MTRSQGVRGSSPLRSTKNIQVNLHFLGSKPYPGETNPEVILAQECPQNELGSKQFGPGKAFQSVEVRSGSPEAINPPRATRPGSAMNAAYRSAAHMAVMTPRTGQTAISSPSVQAARKMAAEAAEQARLLAEQAVQWEAEALEEERKNRELEEARAVLIENADRASLRSLPMRDIDPRARALGEYPLLMTEKDVASLLNLSHLTLRNWRLAGAGKGPVFTTIGGVTRYYRDDVEDYIVRGRQVAS